MEKVLATIVFTLAIAVIAHCQQDLVCLATRITNNPDIQSCFTQLSNNPDPSTFCITSCTRTLAVDYEECGFTGANNPVVTVCPGILSTPPTSIPEGSGIIPISTSDPTCVFNRLLESQGLQQCATQLVFSGTQGFCNSQCQTDLENAYDDCGFSGSFNPATTLCGASSNMTDSTGLDFTCISNSIQLQSNLQLCSTQLAINPTGFCASPCAAQLKQTYISCGFSGDLNPVDTFCRFENLTVNSISAENAICLSNSLQSPNLQLCLVELAINPSGICQTECINTLTGVYNDCGFTGINNPVALVCSYVQNYTSGLDNPLQRCLTSMQQAVQRCIANLIITRNFNLRECASNLEDAFSVCGLDQQIFNLTGIVCTQGDSPPESIPVFPSPGTPSAPQTTSPTRGSNRLGGNTNSNSEESSGSITIAVSTTIITVATLIFSTLV